MLSWFGHVERMSDERMATFLPNDGKVSGKRGKGLSVDYNSIFCSFSKTLGSVEYRKTTSCIVISIFFFFCNIISNNHCKVVVV